MVKTLTEAGSKALKYTKSTYDEIESIRDRAVELCRALDRPLQVPDWGDLEKFWADMDKETSEKETRQILSEECPDLLSYYNFNQLQWGMDFYNFLTEPLWAGWTKSTGFPLKRGWERTGYYDYVMFFSVFYPFPPLTTIHAFVPAAFKERRVRYRSELAKDIAAHDPQTLTKLINGDPIPNEYLAHITYVGLRKLVVRAFVKTNLFRETKQAFEQVGEGKLVVADGKIITITKEALECKTLTIWLPPEKRWNGWMPPLPDSQSKTSPPSTGEEKSSRWTKKTLKSCVTS